MKFAIFGDIHANLEALQAVIADSEAQGCASYVCLGDIVGYAANPSECLEIVRAMNCPVVRGNHDEGAASTSLLEELNPLAQRAAVMAALESVSLVTWFDEDTPAKLIDVVRPDVLVKGGDWPIERIVGSAETLARGGLVHSIPFEFETSTTAMLNRIRAQG